MSSEANNEATQSPATPSPDPHEPASVGAMPAAEQALPSVIVDPSASEPSLPAVEASVIVESVSSTPPTESAAVAPPTNHEATGPEATVHEETVTDTVANQDADDDGEWAVGAFSEHEADQFADSMRPSWDFSTAEAETSWSATSHPVAAVKAPAARVIAAPVDSDDVPPVALAKGFDRRALIAGAGALLVIITVIWSMSGGEPEAPPSWNKETGTQGQEQAVTPATTAIAPAPSVTPSTPVLQAPRPNQPIAPREAPTAPLKATATTAPQTVATKSVHVRISTVPASAEVKLDGEVVPNPFDAWVARGGVHTVVANADGYTEREWSVAFDQDQTLSLVLKHEAVRRPAARRTRRPPAKKAASQNGSRPRGAGFVTDNPY